jgi:IS5 family transposase
MIIEHKALGMVEFVLGFQGDAMSQLSFSDVEYGAKREIFLAEMDSVVPWDSMIDLIEPVYPKSAVGRPAYALPSMLRVWAVPGFKDTLLRCFLELEVLDGTAQEFFEGVQARGGQSRCVEGRECCSGLPRSGHFRERHEAMDSGVQIH